MATVTTQIIDAPNQLFNIPLAKKTQPQQPDIEYRIDRTKWEARTARRLAADPSLPNKALPLNFPKKLESPMVWEGSDWKDEKQYIYRLTSPDLDDLAQALKHFRSLGKPLGFVSKSTFPLSILGPVLADIAHELHAGRGFSVIRGIPVDSYSREDIVIMYEGISSHISTIRGIVTANGGVLAHFKDLSPMYHAQDLGSPAYTTDKQAFHTDDGSDITSIMCLETSAEGGAGTISSGWRVYNHLAEHRPDLIETLSQPWPWDNFGGDPAYYNRPLLSYLNGKMMYHFARRYFTGFQGLPRSTEIPPISEAQAEALDTVHFLAEKYQLKEHFQKGDIRYLNNLSVLHARDAFKDDKNHTRHLIALLLRNEELAWEVPQHWHPLRQKLYYSLTPEQQKFPLEPEIRSTGKGRGAM